MEKLFENAQKQLLLLRYQNYEMEQYSRRESVRFFGTEGNTAEETEDDQIRNIILITKKIDIIIQSSNIYIYIYKYIIYTYNWENGGSNKTCAGKVRLKENLKPTDAQQEDT